jgi:hypothetical protein
MIKIIFKNSPNTTTAFGKTYSLTNIASLWLGCKPIVLTPHPTDSPLSGTNHGLYLIFYAILPFFRIFAIYNLPIFLFLSKFILPFFRKTRI